MSRKKCESCGQPAPLTAENVANILALYVAGHSQKTLAERYGVSQPYICKLLASFGGKTQNSDAFNVEDEI